MKVGIKKTVEVEAKTLQIHIKIRDNFSCTLVDQDGEDICEQLDDYVPDFMPGEHFGDYIYLDIDIDSGQVTNWVKPDVEQLQNWIEKQIKED